MILLLFAPDADASHAFYLSVIEIRHEAGVDSVEVKVKVFTDDLYTALLNEDSGLQHSGLSDFYTEHKSAVEKYFMRHLQLAVNEMPLDLQIAQVAEEADALWISISATTPARWRKLVIEADYFMEVYPTQSQMVHIRESDTPYTLRLVKNRVRDQVYFE